MIKKYIKGHATRGNEVVAELEKLGGVSLDNWDWAFPFDWDGTMESYVYL